MHYKNNTDDNTQQRRNQTTIANGLLEYETQKVVQIHSKKVGITFRLIQLGIILYVVLWVMVYEKGYQSFDQAVSGVTAKLKGIAFANVTNDSSIGATVWDAADYVIPPQQNSAFFVMTNLVATPGQSLGRCEESHDVYKNECQNDTQCRAGDLVMTGSGMKTGRCVPSTRAKMKVCEIYGWCPTEYDITPKPHLLASAENFTVMLKNSIEFPRYKVKRRNILEWMDKLFLKTCRYNPYDKQMKFCPIFRLGDILKYSDAQNKAIWQTGGMVSIHIEWNCNLDYDTKYCVPKYYFRRLDDFKSPVGEGWNFRYSQHFVENGIRKRNLIKAYGIQFFITVYGTGGKFNVLTFSMNLGSGLALLGIATVLCDMIVLNTTRKRALYRKAKVDLIAQKRKERQDKNRMNDRQKKKSTSDAPSQANGDERSEVSRLSEEPDEKSTHTSHSKCSCIAGRKKEIKPIRDDKSENTPQWTDDLHHTKSEGTEVKGGPNDIPIFQPSLIAVRMDQTSLGRKPLPNSSSLGAVKDKVQEQKTPRVQTSSVSSLPRANTHDQYLPRIIVVHSNTAAFSNQD
ncbi:unnamed protein product [Calicophoron daubneyi]|uniref:Purinergic receptor n=1 Tax=Calicophoron daubneyi TaxID=300641 RepID=A0AAV2TJ24_CALDB